MRIVSACGVKTRVLLLGVLILQFMTDKCCKAVWMEENQGKEE